MEKTRRALITGTLAAPVVFTVRTASGTALSSAMACIEKDDDRAHHWPYPDKCVEGSREDEWLRVKKDLVEIHKYGTNKPLTNRRFFLSHDGDKYWELIKDGNGYRAEPKYSTAEYGKYRKVGEGKFLAYHDNGDIVGYGWEDKHGKNITKSCWTSLRLGKHW
jgi:hypothetical protein